MINDDDIISLFEYCLPVSSNIFEEFLEIRIDVDNRIICHETQKSNIYKDKL